MFGTIRRVISGDNVVGSADVSMPTNTSNNCRNDPHHDGHVDISNRSSSSNDSNDSNDNSDSNSNHSANMMNSSSASSSSSRNDDDDAMDRRGEQLQQQQQQQQQQLHAVTNMRKQSTPTSELHMPTASAPSSLGPSFCIPSMTAPTLIESEQADRIDGYGNADISENPNNDTYIHDDDCKLDIMLVDSHGSERNGHASNMESLHDLHRLTQTEYHQHQQHQQDHGRDHQQRHEQHQRHQRQVQAQVQAQVQPQERRQGHYQHQQQQQQQHQQHVQRQQQQQPQQDQHNQQHQQNNHDQNQPMNANDASGFPAGVSSLSTMSTHEDARTNSLRDMSPMRVMNHKMGAPPLPRGSAMMANTPERAHRGATPGVAFADEMDPEDRDISKYIQSQLPRNDSRVSNDSSSTSNRAGSQTSSRDWGWFEDVHMSEHHGLPFLRRRDQADEQAGRRTNGSTRGLVPNPGFSPRPMEEIIQVNLDAEATSMGISAPTYVLEESLSSQRLWRDTAGNRPPQPAEERAFFEMMWAKNFEKSKVDYDLPVDILTAPSPVSLCPYTGGNFDESGDEDITAFPTAAEARSAPTNPGADAAAPSRTNDQHRSNQSSSRKTVKGTGDDGELEILVQQDNKYGTTVSKSFARSSGKGGPIIGIDTVNISIGRYRVVESKRHGKYAQFLVVYREGSIRDTIGVWKRFSDFVELSNKVTHAHEGCATVIANISPLAVTQEHEIEHLPNAITSWRLMKKQQRWYRCYDVKYLGIKAFMLERFLHDILFESSSPNLLRDFVGAGTSPPLDS